MTDKKRTTNAREANRLFLHGRRGKSILQRKKQYGQCCAFYGLLLFQRLESGPQ
ncbi:MAG: hypothetical protein ACLSCV_07395 [Acutalibacteraceae bacterium]